MVVKINSCINSCEISATPSILSKVYLTLFVIVSRFWTRPTDPWCHILQVLLKRNKQEGGMSNEEPPILYLFNVIPNVHKVSYLIIFCWLLCNLYIDIRVPTVVCFRWVSLIMNITVSTWYSFLIDLRNKFCSFEMLCERWEKDGDCELCTLQELFAKMK